MKKTFCFTFVLLSVCLAYFFINKPGELVPAINPESTIYAASSDKAEISIIIPREYQGMGSYTISIEDSEGGLNKIPNGNDKFTFDVNTTIIIKAAPKPFHKFTGFRQNFPSELIDGDTLRVKVLSKREFVLLFEKEVINIDDTVTTKISKGTIHVAYDEITLDAEIYVSVDLNSLYEIKDFIINGIAVNNSSYAGNINYSDNVAVIRVTEDWLAGYGKILDIEVTTKIKETYLIVGLCAVVIIPLFLLLALFISVMNNRTKKAAASSIIAKQATMQRMKTGEYIAGLRDGTVSGANKESIKKEVDKNKD